MGDRQWVQPHAQSLTSESKASPRPKGSDYVMSGPGLNIQRCPRGKSEAAGGKLPWLGYHPLLQELGQVPEPEDPRHFRTGRGEAGC